MMWHKEQIVEKVKRAIPSAWAAIITLLASVPRDRPPVEVEALDIQFPVTSPCKVNRNVESALKL